MRLSDLGVRRGLCLVLGLVLVSTGLAYAQDDALAQRRAACLERHRADRLGVGRKPVRVRNEELTSRFELDDGSAKHAAHPSQHFVLRDTRRPLDGIVAKRTWMTHRPAGVPPDSEVVSIEERIEDTCGGRFDGQAVVELTHVK